MHSLYHASPALGQRVSNKQFTIGHCILPPFFKMWMNIWRVIFFFLGSYKDWVLKSRVKKRIMSWVWPSYYLDKSRWKKGKLHLKILFSVPLVEGINWHPSIIYRLNTTTLMVPWNSCSLVFLVLQEMAGGPFNLPCHFLALLAFINKYGKKQLKPCLAIRLN